MTRSLPDTPRRWLLAASAVATAAALLSGCVAPSAPATAPQATATTSPRPRLVVFIAVDGLPQRQVVQYQDQLAPDGLARFLNRGAWFAEAHYTHAFTVTAAGHATMLTGAYPHRTGVIGNDWRDPATGEMVYCTGDTTATYLGGNATKPLDGTSPRNLRVPTVGDVLREREPRAKVIGISGKDRGAILPAGKTGTAYMYMAGSGQFASSTFYMKEHPAWVTQFNAAKPADRFFKQTWAPLLGDDAYARSLPDGQPWYPKPGPAASGLPAMMGAGMDAPGPAFYAALLRGPFADELTLDFARAAIAGEGMGQDEVPDILAISLSGHDYVNHAFSAESRPSHDHLLRLDRMLQAFFRDLDATIGKDQYLAVLTADHGFTPAPETMLAKGLPAGRQSLGSALTRMNDALARRFGEGKWIHGYSGSTVLFDKKLVAARKVDANDLAEEARKVLLAEPGIGAVYTRRELDGNTRVGEPHFAQMRRAWHPAVSGDLQLAMKVHWMAGSSGATHGTPHAYDSHVPVMFYGPRWVGTGRVDSAVEVVDIAPTLARVLDVPAPPASEGRLLPLPLPMPMR